MKRRDFLKALAAAPLAGVTAKKTEPQLLMKDVDGWVKKNDHLFQTRPVTIYDISTSGFGVAFEDAPKDALGWICDVA